MQTSDAKRKSSEAKDKAWTQFVNQFPNAEVTQIVSQASIDENNNFSAEVFYKAGPDFLKSVFGSNRQYWSQKTWLRTANMKYWPQQLNFGVFCASLGCGNSREIFDSGLSLTPQIRALYQFHVYFTIRRILY